MTHISPAGEPLRLALARNHHDPDSERRTVGDLLDQLRVDPRTHALQLRGTHTLAHAQGIHYVPLIEITRHAPDAPLLYMGRTLSPVAEETEQYLSPGTPIVAVQTPTTNGSTPDGETQWKTLRELGPTLSSRDAGLFAQSLAVTQWSDRTTHSPHTGERLHRARAGWALSEVAGTHYPRIDPAIIVAVTDPLGRILLVNNHKNAPNRYSLIAGFVDPGESLEAAAAREVWEETGARIQRIRYAGSQPWPFPSSLMVGFTAELTDMDAGEIRPDETEIRRVGWFTRDDVRTAVASPERRITLPDHPSIARALIEQWNGAPIKDTA